MPLQDTINSIPQADTDRIARRLLGDQMVDRYGDVIGARPHGFKDVMRDFGLGAAGGPDKALELKMKVRDNFQKAYDREAKAAAARRQEERDQIATVLNTFKTIQGLPPGHRAAILQDTLDNAGIPYSKAAVKLFSDGDILANLPVNDLLEKNANGDIDIGSLSTVFGSGVNAANYISAMTRAQKDREQTGNMILDGEIKRVRLQDVQRKIAEQRETERLRQVRLQESVKGMKLRNAQTRKNIAKPGKGGGFSTGDPAVDGIVQEAMGAGGPPAPAPAAPAAAPASGVKVTKITPVTTPAGAPAANLSR